MKTKLLYIFLATASISVGVLAHQHFSQVTDFKKAVSTTFKASTNTQEAVIFDLNTVPTLLSASNTVSNSRLARLILPKPYTQLLQVIVKYQSDIETVLNQLTTQPQKWIIIFQNSNEIRAMGGFMGSYAIIDINQGKIISITTEDIYDADGQFSGFVVAPPGVAEYLSSGNGLRLPDANWYADTKKSSQQILHFFALGNKQNVSGIIFVNLDFAKALLDFIGPVEIHDYNTVVTSENIDEVLRSRRSDFFPGSTQKKHMLSQLLTQVRIQLVQTNPEKILKLMTLVGNQIALNNLQFYSNNQDIDSIFTKYHMRQELLASTQNDYLYFIESNVGINKANKNIERRIEISKDQNNRTITAYFTNHNTQPTTSKLTEVLEVSQTDLYQDTNHLAYINYQRVLVPENWNLQSITQEGNSIKDFHQETITTQNDVSLKQIGFLSIVQEAETSVISLEFTTQSTADSIYIQKQPGVPATNYLVRNLDQSKSTTIEKNTLIQYPL